jgi:hypothetical protein
MPRYTAAKLRRAFEILHQSGKLDEVAERLEDNGFSVQVSAADAKALAKELNDALGTAQTDSDEDGKPKPQIADPNCPC